MQPQYSTLAGRGVSESLQRAVRTLDALARAETDLSIRELADEVGVSKSAVQRLLSSLLESGLAVQDPVSRRYGLGPRTLVLGTAYQRRIDLRSVALRHMVHLRDLTGETVGLSVRVGDELLHVEQVESASALRRSFEIGRTLPLWCGAPSRLFLADLPDAEVREILRRRRPAAVVPAAPPTARSMAAAVREARERGFAVAYGETIAGVNTVATGLTGADGRVAATLSVTGPSTRWDAAAIEQWTPQLLETTAAVSDRLGHRR
jgi:DNA-binding IclR family transcriptional regulator